MLSFYFYSETISKKDKRVSLKMIFRNG